jgi:uncharacterized membrane protein
VPHELIHPNWHVTLIHYPIALLTLGLAVELFSFLYRRGTLRAAGRWMLMLGAFSCLPAASSGIYAYYDTIRHAGLEEKLETEPGQKAWYQLTRDAENHLSNQQWDDLKHHIWRAASGAIIVLFGVLLYLGASDRWRRRFYFPCLLIILFATVVLMSGAWHAGESIYTRGTAIERDATGVVLDPEHLNAAARGVFPPLQMHVIFAGVTMAMALAALGVSIRALVTLGPAPEENPPPQGEAWENHDTAYADSPVVQRQMTVLEPPPRVYAARFWLMAMLLGVATAAGGVCVAGWSWEAFKPLIGQPRDLAHLSFGAAIILLTLVLAGVTRWAGRRKWMLGALAAILVLIIAAQVWIGILLMYDGSDGGASLYHFRKPVVQHAD